MKNRKNLINAINDCSLDKLDLSTMEEIACMNDDELVQHLVHELYSLRYSYDNLLDKAVADQEKMLEKIKELEIKIAIKEIC